MPGGRDPAEMLHVIGVVPVAVTTAVNGAPTVPAGNGDVGPVMAGATAVEATVTWAVPAVVPLDARTVKGPPGWVPAVNSPEASIVPPPDTDQANA
ncbi:MAG TPA: hypothetical protein VEJ18_16625, partial [Planctomycetota bacterium]|nr:hypothetical protein [Planctomycetota bacterium]